jgi:hypothetical protein
MIPSLVFAQVQRDVVPLRPWPAPWYWQPTQAENQIFSTTKPDTFDNVAAATTPANSLVFVGMTPCRVVDTRPGQGFTGAFGPPSLVGGAKRTFPIQSSTTCSIPSIAQAYSFNITIAPPGLVDFVTVSPTPLSLPPTFSTLNGYVNTVIANAAIVPAGTGGSVDVYASQNTHLIIDINGYYAPQSGITLAPGSAGAPALSFSGDPGTGIFSAGPGTLSLATGGTNRLTLRSDGDLDLTGNIRKGGTLFLHNMSGGGLYNTGVGLGALPVTTVGAANTASGTYALNSNTNGSYNTATGSLALYSNTTGDKNTATGDRALVSNRADANTATGYRALYSNTDGYSNTAMGNTALYSNWYGFFNTATGDSALYSNTTGESNTATGASALRLNTSGDNNTATGRYALDSNETGDSNTATGGYALYVNTTGSLNTATGRGALGANTNGSYNTASGWGAGISNVGGSNNTFIGRGADASSGFLSNATAIGYNASVNTSNKIRLGNAGVVVIEGQVPYTWTSDKNAKENFRAVDAEDVLKKVARLPVPSWNYIGHEPKEFRHYGPMAQDFFAAFGNDEIGRIGSPTTLNSLDMSGILMLAVQALEKRSTDLQEDNEALRSEKRKLEDHLNQQEERIRRLEAALNPGQ